MVTSDCEYTLASNILTNRMKSQTNLSFYANFLTVLSSAFKSLSTESSVKIDPNLTVIVLLLTEVSTFLMPYCEQNQFFYFDSMLNFSCDTIITAIVRHFHLEFPEITSKISKAQQNPIILPFEIVDNLVFFLFTLFCNSIINFHLVFVSQVYLI